jgi:cytochrome c-type biogenesis protein CcmE
MKPKTIVGITLLAVFGFLVMRSFGAQVGGYMSFAEAAATEGRAHVVGSWENIRPTTYDPSTNVFSFWMRDGEGDVRQVLYARPKPANFEEAEQVVIEGRMQGEAFVAENILIKCPSKYNDGREFQDPDAHPGGIPITPATPVTTPPPAAPAY